MKVCPLAAANPQQQNSDCLEEACACYVKMHKPRPLQADNLAIADPEYFYRYRGCALVTHIPWDPVKQEKNQSTSGRKQAMAEEL
jgi:hypothetical protein